MKKLKRIIASASAAAMAASALLAAVPDPQQASKRKLRIQVRLKALWLLKTTVHRCV